MSPGIQKLKRDLTILAAMASEMEEYLKSDVLFWPMMTGGLPKLTLGGYLMREHRLLALRHLLDATEQAHVDTAVIQFNEALVEKVVRLEQKAHRELGARIRQWGEYLKDLDWERSASVANYRTAVDTRAMIAGLMEKLQTAPYRLEPRYQNQTNMLDANLRRNWRRGAFVWPEGWRPAYPEDEFWWLYGRPKEK